MGRITLPNYTGVIVKIFQVVEGLKAGKVYRRSAVLANGDEYTEHVRRIGNAMFRHEVSGTNAAEHEEWGWGGSADLPMELLPGRFDTEGWEEVDIQLPTTCPQCYGRAKKHEWDPSGHAGQASQFHGVDVYECTRGCLVECEYSDKEHPCWWPFLFTLTNKEGFTRNEVHHRPNGRIAVCSPHNHS